MRLDELMQQEDLQGLQLVEIRVKEAPSNPGEFLVVLKARLEGRPVVAFSSGSTVLDAISTAVERMRNSTMRWREDRPFPTG